MLLYYSIATIFQEVHVDAAGRVVKLFDELIAEGEAIKLACKKLYFSGQKRAISPEVFTAWKTKCLSLLKSTFGSSSPQFDSFVNAKFFDYYNATQVFLGILKAASQDIRKGYFFHKDLMLSVNIYDSLLARAGKQIEEGKPLKAAAILEAVLREVLGKICQNKNIPYAEDDGIAALADTLTRTQTIPVSVRERLLELDRLFRSTELSTVKLTVATEFVLSFLNEYLGGQILILN
jgi:hypothetical protein